jgi:hypothetical protein
MAHKSYYLNFVKNIFSQNGEYGEFIEMIKDKLLNGYKLI